MAPQHRAWIIWAKVGSVLFQTATIWRKQNHRYKRECPLFVSVRACCCLKWLTTKSPVGGGGRLTHEFFCVLCECTGSKHITHERRDPFALITLRFDFIKLKTSLHSINNNNTRSRKYISKTFIINSGAQIAVRTCFHINMANKYFQPAHRN